MLTLSNSCLKSPSKLSGSVKHFRSLSRRHCSRLCLNLFLTACLNRISSCLNLSSQSCLSGTTLCAAAVGVGALSSAAKSVKTKSVSCPTALMVGIRDSATALTTISSLNAQRSSTEPPPRPTMRTSILPTLCSTSREFASLMA